MEGAGGYQFRRNIVHRQTERGPQMPVVNADNPPHYQDWRTKLYIPRASKSVYNVGAALLDQNIIDAFDNPAIRLLRQGIKLALPKCTLVPFSTPATLNIEEIYICGVCASMGVAGNRIEQNMLIRYLCGNAFCVDLPERMSLSPEAADRAVVDGMAYMLETCTAEIRTEINRRFADEEGNPPIWMTPNHYGDWPQDQGSDLVEIMSICLSTDARSRLMSAYVAIFLAYTRQGNITPAKLQKVQADLMGQQIQINVTTDMVRELWDIYGGFFTERAASTFFPRWEQLFVNGCMRLRLIMQQAALPGFTGLQVVRSAVQSNPDFDWDKLAGLLGNDFINYQAANEAIGENSWYGYRHDLGHSNYIQTVYCAMQLLERANGDMYIRNLMFTRGKKITCKNEIDKLIDHYLDYKCNQGIEGNADAARAIFGDVVPANAFAATQYVPPQQGVNY